MPKRVYVYLPASRRDCRACVLEVRDRSGCGEPVKKLEEMAGWIQRTQEFLRDAPEELRDALDAVPVQPQWGIAAAPVAMSPSQLARDAAGTDFDPSKPCIMEDREDTAAWRLVRPDMKEFRHHGDGCSLTLDAGGALCASVEWGSS